MSGMMSQPSQVAVVVSVVFGVTGVWSLVSLVRADTVQQRVYDGTHLAMSVVMATMPFAWYSRIPVWLQLVAFSTAALWFVRCAVFGGSAVSPQSASDHHTSDGPGPPLYHAAMMGAMVWMALAMTPWAPGSTASSSGMAGMSDMAGTSGMSGMSGTDLSAPMAMTGSRPWAEIVTWGFGLLFVVAALVLLGSLLRAVVVADRLDRGVLLAASPTAVSALMAGGMAVAFVVLMT